MTFDAALEQIREWTARSEGHPIALPSGDSCCFSSAPYSEDDLATFERHWQIVLPSPYERFLLHLGPGRFFFNDWEVTAEFGEIEILPLDQLYERFAVCFTRPKEVLFSKLLPVGFDNFHQEMLFFALSRPGPSNFLRIWHETHTDEWISYADRINSWTSFEDWVVLLVESQGRVPL